MVRTEAGVDEGVQELDQGALDRVEVPCDVLVRRLDEQEPERDVVAQQRREVRPEPALHLLSGRCLRRGSDRQSVEQLGRGRGHDLLVERVL